MGVQEKQNQNQTHNRKQSPGIPTLPRLDFVTAVQGGHTLLNIKVISHLPKTQSKRLSPMLSALYLLYHQTNYEEKNYLEIISRMATLENISSPHLFLWRLSARAV